MEFEKCLGFNRKKNGNFNKLITQQLNTFNGTKTFNKIGISAPNEAISFTHYPGLNQVNGILVKEYGNAIDHYTELTLNGIEAIIEMDQEEPYIYFHSLKVYKFPNYRNIIVKNVGYKLSYLERIGDYEGNKIFVGLGSDNFNKTLSFDQIDANRYLTMDDISVEDEHVYGFGDNPIITSDFDSMVYYTKTSNIHYMNSTFSDPYSHNFTLYNENSYQEGEDTSLHLNSVINPDGLHDGLLSDRIEMEIYGKIFIEWSTPFNFVEIPENEQESPDPNPNPPEGLE